MPLSKTRRLAIDAILASMVAVLGYLAINAGTFKITIEGLPIILTGFLFGSWDGVLVALIGSLIYQIAKFGLSPTTILWVIPYLFPGLICGLFAKKTNGRLSKKQIFVAIILSQVLVTVLNSIALYIDGHIYGYYNPKVFTGMLLPRFALSIGKSIVYTLVMPSLLKALDKFRPYPGKLKKDTARSA